MKKSSKLLTTILGSTVIASGFVSLAVTGLNTTSVVVASNSTKKVNTQNAVKFWNVTYNNPGIPGFKYLGSNVVRTRDGTPLGTVTPPKIICNGYTFGYWTEDLSNPVPIKPTQAVTANINLYPVMNKVIDELKIVSIGDVEKQYQGFNQTYTYSLSGPAEKTDPASINWEVKGPNDEDISSIISFTITQGTVAAGTNLNVYITPTTEHLITQPVDIVINATYNGQTVKFPTVVLPPFYANNVVIPTDPASTVQVGTGYWFIIDGLSGLEWDYSESGNICSETSKITMTNYDKYDSGQPVSVEYERTTSNAQYIKHVFPGCQIKVVDDFFLSGVTHFNGVLHGGVDPMGDEKVIHAIHDDFLSGCSDFNQNINDIFAVGKLTSLTIGDDFMMNCDHFNNGNTDTITTEPFSLPEAQKYGDMFMAGCSALTGDIVLPETIRMIGNDFMSDCSQITSFTIPEECDDVLWKIGAYCCYNCEDLARITIETTSVKYFDEIESQDKENRGSFIKLFSDLTHVPTFDDFEPITVIATNAAVTEEFISSFDNALNYKETSPSSGVYDGYYRYVTTSPDFDWDKFLTGSSDTSISNDDVESDWKYLDDSIKNGLTPEKIQESISKSEILNQQGLTPFSWANSYEAKVRINGALSTVRLVGLGEDDLQNGGKAATTWEFISGIAGHNGNDTGDKNDRTLRLYWGDWENDGPSGEKLYGYGPSVARWVLNTSEKLDPNWNPWRVLDGSNVERSAISDEQYGFLHMLADSEKGSPDFLAAVKTTTRKAMNFNTNTDTNFWVIRNFDTQFFFPSLSCYFPQEMFKDWQAEPTCPEENGDFCSMEAQEHNQYQYYADPSHIGPYYSGISQVDGFDCLKRKNIDGSPIAYDGFFTATVKHWGNSFLDSNTAFNFTSWGKIATKDVTNYCFVQPMFCI